MYYLPNINYRCFVVQDYNTIRAYEEVPRQNSTISYTDYFVNSHYMHRSGTQTFSQYTSNLPTCLGNGEVTNNVFYRNDFGDIMIIFFLLLIICFYFPYRIISRAFGRWLKW